MILNNTPTALSAFVECLKNSVRIVRCRKHHELFSRVCLCASNESRRVRGNKYTLNSTEILNFNLLYEQGKFDRVFHRQKYLSIPQLSHQSTMVLKISFLLC